MSLISSLEHAFAVGAQKIVAEARMIEQRVLPALITVEATSTTVEAITGLMNPAAVNIERQAYAALAVIIRTIEDAGPAATAGGMNLSLDAALIADVKAIIPAVKGAAPVVMTVA